MIQQMCEKLWTLPRFGELEIFELFGRGGGERIPPKKQETRHPTGSGEPFVLLICGGSGLVFFVGLLLPGQGNEADQRRPQQGESTRFGSGDN